jgi:hypothetical protein
LSQHSDEANTMTEAEFRTRRRQQFLTQTYFRLNGSYCQEEVDLNAKAIASKVFGPDNSSFAGVRGSSFKNAIKLLRLHYTAGEPIESLRPLYAEAMKWFTEWHQAYRTYIAELGRERDEQLRDDGTPCQFEDLFHFQLALDVVSLGVLLGEPEQVRGAAQWLTRYRHTDMLFEALVEPAVPDPDLDIGEFFHERPYDPLLDAIYTAKTPEESSAFVKQYLEGWYKAFEGVPWHNGHLVVTDEYSNYEGYWAFEAAAICVIHGIDDTNFRDHMVYPKDLADWARANDVMAKLKPGSGPSGAATAAPVRCEANQPCPHEGYWVTPAKAGSRRHFKQGELMPDLKSDYGLTIWYWDVNQSS